VLSVTVLLFKDHLYCRFANDIRRWQIRLTQPKIDAARKRAIEGLADNTLLDPLQAFWWRELTHRR